MTVTLITGANKGIGFETARQLHEAGHLVYLGARDTERGEKAAAEIGARFVRLDVTDDESVRDVAAIATDHLWPVAEHPKTVMGKQGLGLVGVVLAKQRAGLPGCPGGDGSALEQQNAAGSAQCQFASGARARDPAADHDDVK